VTEHGGPRGRPQLTKLESKSGHGGGGFKFAASLSLPVSRAARRPESQCASDDHHGMISHQQIELRLYAIMFFSTGYTRLCTIILDYTRLF
jgi:hypothetical protein